MLYVTTRLSSLVACGSCKQENLRQRENKIDSDEPEIKGAF